MMGSRLRLRKTLPPSWRLCWFLPFTHVPQQQQRGRRWGSSSSSSKTVLVLSNVLPQASASAAGVRTSFMLERLSQTHTVHFACSSSSSFVNTLDDTETSSSNSATHPADYDEMMMMMAQGLNANKKVTFHHLPLNDSIAVKNLLARLASAGCGSPDIILYDRFYNEEAYSFHFFESCPEAIHIVDMQDMHSLRWGRQALVEQADQKKQLLVPEQKQTPGGGSVDEDVDDNQEDWLRQTPALLYHQPRVVSDKRLIRELASLHRSDLCLVCSPFELNLLRDVYQVPRHKLCLAPFWVPPPRQRQRKRVDDEDQPSPLVSFEKTRDFVFVGGFRHAPNVDAVRTLVQHLWPRIQHKLLLSTKNRDPSQPPPPPPRLHIYGAYPTREILQWHNVARGVLVHGFVASLEQIFANKRVLLAPLRFGAGIKGKIVDSWVHGVPVVTTPIGAQGMCWGDDNNVVLGSSLNSNKKNQHLQDDLVMGAAWRGGLVASTVPEFCDAAVELYTDSYLWANKQQSATNLVHECFPEQQWEQVADALNEVVKTREERRASDVTRAMLWHHTARSTEYFSRWIEAKEAKSESSPRSKNDGDP